jgi:acyl-CoA synthetase (AMP-forming)/AMP-acid ligase II
MQSFNISQLLTEASEKYQDKKALSAPNGKNKDGVYRYSNLSFSELENLTNAYASLLNSNDVKYNSRVLMMVKPGLEFAAAIFAVYRIGAVPILIDPGMGFKNLRGCIRQTEPEAMIAISPAHWARKLFKKDFTSCRAYFSLGKFAPSDCIRLESAATPGDVRSGKRFSYDGYQTTLDDTAAIVFTTGSTGPPKGVVYTHRTFKKQVDIIRNVYGAGPEHVDMSAFPLFALFAVVLGMPSIIPEMDFTRPAYVNPVNIIQAVKQNNVSFSFGSPALWRTVCKYCIAENIKLPTLKKVLMAGAPVTEDLHRMLKHIIAPDGETLVPYGATEALPIANFTGSEMLTETAQDSALGKGYCVGYPNPGIEIKVIKSTDSDIEAWNDELLLPQGKIGEIVVKGDVVKKEYFNRPEHNTASEIKNSDGTKWHRMGDVGYFDSKGRLWFCGRKNHRVITSNKIYYPVCVEAIFNQHPDIYRTALVSDGTDKPVLFAEPMPGKWSQGISAEKQLIMELMERGKEHPISADIEKIILRQHFPVDIRHNAKIFREKLSDLVSL